MEAIACDLHVPLSQIAAASDKLKTVDLKQYVTDAIGEPPLRDILSEFEKPGRDPCAEFKYATFSDAIQKILPSQ